MLNAIKTKVNGLLKMLNMCAADRQESLEQKPCINNSYQQNIVINKNM